MPTLTINNEQVLVDADPDTPLLWVLRDVLGMTGTKFGCGKGLCGACTVHFNGAATRSCLLPISIASTGNILTIEGVENDSSVGGIARAIKQAWLDGNVPQCGYCQPGQIMSAVSLLTTNSSPTSDDIDQKMSGNICRCGSYPRIKQGIKNALQIVEAKE